MTILERVISYATELDERNLKHARAIFIRQAVSLQMRYLRLYAQTGEGPLYLTGWELPKWFGGLQETAEVAADWLFDRGRVLKDLSPWQTRFVAKSLGCRVHDLTEIEETKRRKLWP